MTIFENGYFFEIPDKWLAEHDKQIRDDSEQEAFDEIERNGCPSWIVQIDFVDLCKNCKHMGIRYCKDSHCDVESFCKLSGIEHKLCDSANCPLIYRESEEEEHKVAITKKFYDEDAYQQGIADAEKRYQLEYDRQIDNEQEAFERGYDACRRDVFEELKSLLRCRNYRGCAAGKGCDGICSIDSDICRNCENFGIPYSLLAEKLPWLYFQKGAKE